VKECRAERLCFLFDDDLEDGIVREVMTVVVDRFVVVVTVTVVWLGPTDLMTLWLWLWLRLSPIVIFVASGYVMGGSVCVMDP